MLAQLHRRANDDQGFTLIELLVVILIIGILAAIAIPSFLSQTAKSYDASAKELARTAETTADTWGTDNANNFASWTGTVGPTALNSYEATIPLSAAAAGKGAWLSAATGTGTATSSIYVVTTTAYSTGNLFSIVYQNGAITRFCGKPGWTAPTASTAAGFTATTGTTSGGCVNGLW